MDALTQSYTEVKGSTLNANDVFRYIRIGNIVVFYFQINYSATQDRAFSGIPIFSGQTGVAVRNNNTGTTGVISLNTNTISTYNSGITWASGQSVSGSGAYFTTS